MQLRRPELPVRLVGKAGGGEVVRQGVEPDPRALLLAVARLDGEGDRPRQPRSCNRDVLETLAEQRENLVASRFRPEKFRALVEQALEERLVFRQPKEPVALFRPLQLARGVEHASAIDDLILALEQLAADAVPPLVRLLVEIVRVLLVDALDERDRKSTRLNSS